MTERKWTPKRVGPSSAKMPISAEPSSPPIDDDRHDEPVEDDVELVQELVQPLVDEADLDLAVAHLLQDVVHLVRQLERDPGRPGAPAAREEPAAAARTARASARARTAARPRRR